MPAKLFPNYIDGQWVEGTTFENRNPANVGEVVGLHVSGTPGDIAQAAAAAHAALPGWSALTGPARGAYLYKVADLLDQRFEQISKEMTLEEGKTLPESKGEVRRAINIFRYFAAEGSRFAGVLAPSERDRVQMFAIRKAIGVVGLITPWNFPSAIPAWKLAPALLCGNTVVLKPASAAPLSAWRIVEACHDAGIQKGVVNFVAGSGGSLGRALIEAPALKALSFTGSCAVGHKLHADASARRLRIQLEMGGKNPTIVLADADFNSAVENVANAAFFSTGQKCTATSRAIVEDSIYDRFVEALAERTRRLKVGNGMEPGVEIGPCVDEGQMNTVLGAIELGRKECGEPLAGGHRLTGADYGRGWFVEPTLFADVDPNTALSREEIFGPVLAILPYQTEAEVIRQANDTVYGLAAYVQSADLGRARKVAGEMRAGNVYVNYPAWDTAAPFGGYKQSGNGREYADFGIKDYLEVKAVVGWAG